MKNENKKPWVQFQICVTLKRLVDLHEGEIEDEDLTTNRTMTEN